VITFYISYQKMFNFLLIINYKIANAKLHIYYPQNLPDDKLILYILRNNKLVFKRGKYLYLQAVENRLCVSL
jgi:hypothetical protein